MKRIILVALTILLVSMYATAEGVMQTRSFHYPVWCQRPQDDTGYGLPAWNIAWGGANEVVVFCNGNLINSAPFFTGIKGQRDSIEIHYGLTNPIIHYLDSLIVIAKRNGVRPLMTIQAVSPANWDYIISDSARTVSFFNNFYPWLIRKGFAGWDLNYEGGSPNLANLNRAMRIARRMGYLSGFTGRRVFISTSTPRGSERWFYGGNADTSIDEYHVETSSFSYVWSNSAQHNITYFQTPIFTVGASSDNNAASLNDDGGTNIVQLWANAGHRKTKIIVEFSTSVIGGFLDTDQLLKPYTSEVNDIGLEAVESMLAYGGHKVFDPTALAPYISGTATSGNPVGLSTGTKFFFSYSDSTSIKAGVDLMTSDSAGGVWIYDAKGDMRTGQVINWKRQPYIYSGLVYAARKAGGVIIPPPSSNVDTVYFNFQSFQFFPRVGQNDTTFTMILAIDLALHAPMSGNATVTVTPTPFTLQLTSGQRVFHYTVPFNQRVTK